jgi:hypothetical protein
MSFEVIDRMDTVTVAFAGRLPQHRPHDPGLILSSIAPA